MSGLPLLRDNSENRRVSREDKRSHCRLSVVCSLVGKAQVSFVVIEGSFVACSCVECFDGGQGRRDAI